MKGKTFFIFTLVFFAWFFHTRALFSQDIFRRLEESEKETKAVSFDFRQFVEFDMQNYRQENEGSVVFQKPENLRFELKKPYRQITVSDGKKFYNYNSRTGQVVVADWEKMKKSGLLYGWPESFAGNFAELKKRYDMKLIEETTDYSLISIEDKKADFSMKFYFAPLTFAVDKTEFITKGTRIITNILNYKKNPEIKKNTFKFIPPKGAEIIKQ